MTGKDKNINIMQYNNCQEKLWKNKDENTNSVIFDNIFINWQMLNIFTKLHCA